MTTLFPNDSTLRISRVFTAERSRVFNAWANENIIKQWFCPGNMTVPRASVNFKVGGKYSITMMESEPEIKEHTCFGVYKEIIQNAKIVLTWNWEGGDNLDHETLVTVEFKDTRQGTEMILTHSGFKSTGSRDMHTQGWNACIDNLEAKQLALSEVD